MHGRWNALCIESYIANDVVSQSSSNNPPVRTCSSQIDEALVAVELCDQSARPRNSTTDLEPSWVCGVSYFYEHTQWQRSNSSDQRRNLHSQFNFTLGLMISKAHRFRICCRSIVACLCVLGCLLGKNMSSYCAQKHQHRTKCDFYDKWHFRSFAYSRIVRSTRISCIFPGGLLE